MTNRQSEILLESYKLMKQNSDVINTNYDCATAEINLAKNRIKELEKNLEVTYVS